ncbi:MAG: hypothetical protein EXQ53_07855 [Acidobacteria bacterium]|nr:hypothetical protein [Acidobacteriota bacterium]
MGSRRVRLKPDTTYKKVWGPASASPPDGRRIAFASQRAGAINLFWQAADGTGAADRLTEGRNTQNPSSISADGTQLLFGEQGRPSTDVQVLALAGERRVTPLIATTFTERNGELSTDGRWGAYQSNESGRDEVYVGRSRRSIAGDGRYPPAAGGSRCGRRTAGSCFTSIPRDGSWPYRSSPAPALSRAIRR